MTLTNINFSKKICWCGQLGQSPQPWLASLHWLGHLPSLTSPIASLLYKKKTSGTEVRRTPDVILRFFVVNFSQIQLLRFVVVKIRSNSFDHLDSVKLITLVKYPMFCLKMPNFINVYFQFLKHVFLTP